MRIGIRGLALTLLLGSCTGGDGLEVYRTGPKFLHLAFEYPGSWTAEHLEEQSNFSTLIVYLSNQPMITPCTGGSCGLAVKHLEPGGVLAWWSSDGFPVGPSTTTRRAGR